MPHDSSYHCAELVDPIGGPWQVWGTEMPDDIAKLMNSVRIGRKKRRPPRSKVPSKGAQKDADAPKERAPVPIDPELIKDMKKLQEAANESLPAFKDALKESLQDRHRQK